MATKNLYIDREWETKCIDKICQEIRQNSLINLANKTAVLQLSYEYSGLMAQLIAHQLSNKDEPLDIEPVNIPYKDEFEAVIHPDQLDPYYSLIVVDSGCLSGNNFRKIEKRLLDYGYPRSQLYFTCVACDLNSVFRPDFCPIYFDGDTTMAHFWWETKTDKFQRNKDGK
jgi:hypothetical protein